MDNFKTPVSKFTKALYGGLTALLIGSGIISYSQEGQLSALAILVLAGVIPLFILLMPYRIRYRLTEDALVCEWLFGKVKIPYNTIEEVRSFHLPLKSIRRFGISLIGGRFSSKGTGKFYAMFGGKRDGLMIISNSEELYGGQIYITPEDEEEFIQDLKYRTNAAFSLDNVIK